MMDPQAEEGIPPETASAPGEAEAEGEEKRGGAPGTDTTARGISALALLVDSAPTAAADSGAGGTGDATVDMLNARSKEALANPEEWGFLSDPVYASDVRARPLVCAYSRLMGAIAMGISPNLLRDTAPIIEEIAIIERVCRSFMRSQHGVAAWCGFNETGSFGLESAKLVVPMDVQPVVSPRAVVDCMQGFVTSTSGATLTSGHTYSPWMQLLLDSGEVLGCGVCPPALDAVVDCLHVKVLEQLRLPWPVADLRVFNKGATALALRTDGTLLSRGAGNEGELGRPVEAPLKVTLQLMDPDGFPVQLPAFVGQERHHRVSSDPGHLSNVVYGFGPSTVRKVGFDCQLSLVYVDFSTPLDDATAQALDGAIALVRRGGSGFTAFSSIAQQAAAGGAAAVVIVNNDETITHAADFVPTGVGEIPVVMTTQAYEDCLRSARRCHLSIAAPEPDAGDGWGRVLDNVTQIAVGPYHAAALVASGECLTWGWGRNGRLGDGSECTGTSVTAIPSPCAGLAGVFIRVVSCGYEFCMAIADDLRLFGWGDNRDKQLGLQTASGGNKRHVETPTLVFEHVPGDRPVSAVACGSHHTLALVGGSQASRVVQQDKVEKLVAMGFDALDCTGALAQAGSDLNAALNLLLEGYKPPSGRRDGYVLHSWGQNNHGKTGHGLTSGHTATPKVVEVLRDEEIAEINCGSLHSVVLTQNDDVYVFGGGGNGHLGLGDTRSRSTPERNLCLSGLGLHLPSDLGCLAAVTAAGTTMRGARKVRQEVQVDPRRTD